MFNTLAKCGMVMPREVAISSPGSSWEAIVRLAETSSAGEFATVPVAGDSRKPSLVNLLAPHRGELRPMAAEIQNLRRPRVITSGIQRLLFKAL